MNKPAAAQQSSQQANRAPQALRRHYRSIDSAPPAYSVNRPVSATNGALMYFVALSIVALTILTALANLDGAGPARDLVFASPGGQAAAVPVRTFLMLIVTAVAVSLATNWWRRLAVGGELVGVLLLVCLIVDLTAYGADRIGLFSAPVVGQQLASTLAALLVFPFVIMRHAHLPAPVRLRPTGRVRWHAWLRLSAPLMLAFAAAAWIEERAPLAVGWMRDWALLGGVGPGVFLVQQVFSILTACIGLLLIRRSRRARFAPPLAVMIPAHNEAHDITATIAALDRGAAQYAERVHIYVVDNVSTDATSAVAQAAISACVNCSGEVLECAVPGKAVALNYALSVIREDFVVRIDADTLIGENCLDVTLRHFANPRVAAVGGMPRPSRSRSFSTGCGWWRCW